MHFNKILGLACIAAAAILLGLVAFDVPYFKSIYFLRIELAREASKFLDGSLPSILSARNTDGRGEIQGEAWIFTFTAAAIMQRRNLNTAMVKAKNTEIIGENGQLTHFHNSAFFNAYAVNTQM
ncbi:hypothetical protein B0H14DRAFT_3148698 [Mycena olivaceomarginata]|nr:hypothetical protein B0H14DRAFT_3148698 [Mycena olivaceomarginata]